MKKFTVVLLSILLVAQSFKAQTPTQNIRGIIADKQSQEFIPGAVVILMGTDPQKTAISDPDGKFKVYKFQMLPEDFPTIIPPQIDHAIPAWPAQRYPAE